MEMVDALDDEFPEKRRVLALVRKDIEAVRDAMGVDSMASANVTTPLTVQASLKESLLPASLQIVWTQKFELTLPQSWPVLPESTRDPLPALLDPLRNQRRTNNVPPPKPAALKDRWREFFMPAGQVLFNDGQLYFKTDDRLVACDSATGSLEWLGFRNGLPLDENTRLSSRRYPASNGVKVTPYPNTPEEYLIFGDLVNQSMTLSGDTLYSLQGDPLDFQDEEPQTAPIAPNRQQRQFGRQLNAPGRFRENRLVAYDRTSGKLKWYRRAEEPLDPNIPMIRRAGFARAPLAYGSLLLVPVHEETSLWLSGLDRRTGETLWRTFLCDEPAGQCQAMSAVAMTVDAGEVYVSSGAGLLFSVDAISGQLAWAVRYPRRAKFPVSPATNSFVPRYDALSSLLDGWQQDRLLPHGNDVIVAGTDFDHLFAVNRRTGKLTWETARQPFRSKDPSVYVLAAHGGNVYVAGEKSVRCYQSHGGKLIWESILSERSYARCAFTPEAIYVPLESSIVQLDPATGKQVARAKVTLPSEDEPVGNLFTDGERLIVFGLKKVYALALTEPTETLN
ncbi:MAG: outer membrane protein assembly factor BamB [Verrucomicrobiales bacterium]